MERPNGCKVEVPDECKVELPDETENDSEEENKFGCLLDTCQVENPKVVTVQGDTMAICSRHPTTVALKGTKTAQWGTTTAQHRKLQCDGNDNDNNND